MKEGFEHTKRSQEDIDFFNNLVEKYSNNGQKVEQDEEFLIVSVDGSETKTYIHKWRKVPKGDEKGNITGSTDIETVVEEAIEELEAKRGGIDTEQV